MENEKVSGLVFRIGLYGYSENMYKEETPKEEKFQEFKQCLLNIVDKYKATAEEAGLTIVDFKIGLGDIMAGENEFFDTIVKNIEDVLDRDWILYLKSTDAMTPSEVDAIYLKMSESMGSFTAYNMEGGNLIFQSYSDGEYDSGWYNSSDNDSFILTENSDYDEWTAGNFLGALTDELSVKGSYSDLIPLTDISFYSGKPKLLTISTIVWEFEKETGTFTVDDEEIEGYVIFENKSHYEFCYKLEEKKSASRALSSIVTGKVNGYNWRERQGGENKGNTCYNSRGHELEDFSEYSGNEDYKILKLDFSYGWDSVTLELDSGEKFEAPYSSYSSFIEQDNGKIIVEFLRKLVYI